MRANLFGGPGRARRIGCLALIVLVLFAVLLHRCCPDDEDPSDEPPPTPFGEVLEPTLDLDVDTDRDGQVEDDEDDPQEDTWSKARGAVFLNNIDDDDESGGSEDHIDNRDFVVDGEDDKPDLVELVLRVAKRTAADELKLRITGAGTAARNVRIFDENLIPRLGMIGPASLVAEYDVPNVGIDLELVYYVEGLNFPTGDFKYLDMTLEMGAAKDSVRLRIAPYMFLANTETGLICYYGQFTTPSNADFLTDVGYVVPLAKRAIYNQSDYDDEWAQDEFEIGFTAHARSAMHVIWNLPRDRPLHPLLIDPPPLSPPFPSDAVLGVDYGHFADLSRATNAPGDYGGNLEVSFRPVMSEGKLYRFGRAIIGTTASAAVEAFINHQEVQAPPLKLATEWLWVGHVDEVMSVLPGQVILVADTELGWSLFRDAVNQGHGGALLFAGKSDNVGMPVQVTLGQLVSNDATVNIPLPSGGTVTSRDFKRTQEIVQTSFLDLIRKELEKLDGATIKRVPALFTRPWRADAYVPGAVNGLVFDGTYAAPRPYGPELVPGQGDFIAKKISDAIGMSTRFIDDWDLYHMRLGEVHCGTNVKRQLVTPPPAWWDQVEP